MGRREISREECLRFIAQAEVGRVALTVGALPEIIPVNFRVVDGTVVFGVHSESVLAQEAEGTVVAFQADSFDPESERGWHVRAIGTFRMPVRPDELAAAGDVVPEPWARGEEAELVMQIELVVLSGYVLEGAPSNS